MPDKTLTKFLNRIPRFYYKGEDGDLHKLHKSIGSVVDTYVRDKILIEASKEVIRPIQLWRIQTKPSIFSLNIRVQLDDIKRVRLYQEETGDDLLLYDSGVLGSDTSEFSYILDLSVPTIISDEKYYVVVEDYLDNIFKKGIPENSVNVGDIYDPDPVLDRFGQNWGVPRLRFTPPTDPEEYQYTYPNYYLDGIEPDYYYEQRLLLFKEDIRTKKLTEVELYKYFLVYPQIMGRWRHLCRMNYSYQNRKFMRSAEWNSAVFDVSADFDDIPSNLEIPTSQLLEDMIEKVFPLSKKAYFSLASNDVIGEDYGILTDYLEFALNMPYDNLITEGTISLDETVSNYDFIDALIFDNMEILVELELMTICGKSVSPSQPRIYPKPYKFITELGESLEGDYTLGYLSETGDEIPPSMIQRIVPPTPVEGLEWDTFAALDDGLLIGVLYDNLRINKNGTAWVANLTNGTSIDIPPVQIGEANYFVVYANDNRYMVSTVDGTIFNDEENIGFNKITPSGFVVLDSYFSSFLNVGEEVIDVAIRYGMYDLFFILTDSRLIKATASEAGIVFIEAIAFTNGLMFTKPYWELDLDTYFTIIKSDGNLATVICNSVDSLSVESTSTLPEFDTFTYYYGFFSGSRVSGTVLELLNGLSGCIELITSSIKSSWHMKALYSNRVAELEFNWETTIFEEVNSIPLEENNGHHICFMNTVRPA